MAARWWKYLKDNNEPIAAVTAIVGVAVGVLGFVATYYQLSETSRALRASNTYSIQKDARELNDKLQERMFVRKMVNNQLSDAETPEAIQDLWKMLNFYLSVFRQVEAGGVSSEFSASFQEDFCTFVKISSVSKAWDDMIKSNQLNEAHIQMRKSWCKNV